ncbi:MAG: hypothetical protein ACOX3T_06405 [Bdellovibrionota bacterium]
MVEDCDVRSNVVYHCEGNCNSDTGGTGCNQQCDNSGCYSW